MGDVLPDLISDVEGSSAIFDQHGGLATMALDVVAGVKAYTTVLQADSALSEMSLWAFSSFR